MAARPRRAERMPPDERRAAIVDATLPLLHEHGSAVTVRQIAAAAGIAEGTIFTVFPDKDALIAAVVAKAFAPEPTLRELDDIDRTMQLDDRLVRVVVILQERLRSAFGLITALRLTGPPEPDSERGVMRQRGSEAIMDAIVDVIAPDEHVLTLSARELAVLIRMLTFSATHSMINDGRPLGAEQIVGVLLDGTRAAALAGATRTDPATHHDSRGN